ncbi:MAG: hypothetical protein J6T39_01995, partial [Clostridia bacterium]|nr:hypothetical protein [Clostridia bacterium]
MGSLKKKTSFRVIVWIVLVMIMLFRCIYVFINLKYGLLSLFDEGLFFMEFVPKEMFSVRTEFLSLSGELFEAVFPNVCSWDVLKLRQVGFGVISFGILILLAGSCVFFYRKGVRDVSSFLSLAVCVLLFGGFVYTGIVINANDGLLFFEMLSVASCLLAVSSHKTWSKSVLICAFGLFAFFAVLCNAFGGGMLFLLCALFLVLYDGLGKKTIVLTASSCLLGVVLSIAIMHYAIISIPDFMAFVKTSFAQVTDGGVASHHSLSKVLLVILFGVRDLMITVVALLGITYIYNEMNKRSIGKWMVIMVGVALFVLLYLWLKRPKIGLISIVTWISIVLWVELKVGKRSLRNKEFVLFLYLYLLPLCVSFGTNVSILSKAMCFIVPWGIMLFLLGQMAKEKSRFSPALFYGFVFVFVLSRWLTGMVSQGEVESYKFDKEKPIARMQLTKAQSDFYNEIYDVLDGYGYESQHDTILGFCFNEMTIVAMNAIPYTNDQQPEEFLLHDKAFLPKPTFMILSEWDIKVLKPFLELLEWKFPEDYDAYKMEYNPDPDSGFDMTQSTL